MKKIIIFPFVILIWIIGKFLQSLESRVVEVEKIIKVHHIYWPKPDDFDEGTEYEWMKIPLCSLDKKRLHNIIAAMFRGYWKTYGTEVRINEDLKYALIQEYNNRNITDVDIIAIEQANAEYEGNLSIEKDYFRRSRHRVCV